MAPRRLSDSEKQDLVGRYKAGESTTNVRKNVRKTLSVEKLQSWLVPRIARVDWPCQKPPQQKQPSGSSDFRE